MSDIQERKKTYTIISVLIVAIGLVLMAGKMYFDSEPGAIPLALILLGLGWNFTLRFRSRDQQNP